LNSYQYIQSLFKAVLLQSKQIQGRLVLLPEGDELNFDNFERLVTEANKDVKFPTAAWAPPRSSGKFVAKYDEWEEYTMQMFFLNTTYYSANNQVAKRNPGTGVSDKPVIEEWENMKVAAVDFIRVLQLVLKGNNNTSVNMLDAVQISNKEKFIQPVSFVGTKRLSGVRLQFILRVFANCNIQDYIDGGIIVLPDLEDCSFDADLVVVRNEVITIIEEMGVQAGSMNYVIDGGGAAISIGVKGVIEWGFNAEILGWTILADVVGDIVVDVWRDSYGNFEPTVGDTIAGTEKPTLSAAKKNQNLTLASFNKTVTQGDIWAFNVDSVADVTKVTLAFRFNKQ